jgi:biopolymer transport protein ExbD
MADARQQYIDVWVVDSNTVYREVPYTVVCDWVQQGRLLEDDNVRRSGTAEWRRIGAVPAFAAFLPKPEPTRPDDKAEALEPVEFEFGWKKKHTEHEDEEVDMIPLIDVSLVLLIFFMLTASSAAAAAFVKLAGVKKPPVADTAGISINMNVEVRRDGKRVLVYELGEDGRRTSNPEDRDIRDQRVLLQQLNTRLAQKTDTVDITINPHSELEDGELVEMLRAVKTVPNHLKIGRIYNGVTEAKP